MRSLFLAVFLCAASLVPMTAGDADAPKIAVLRLQDLLSTCKAYRDQKEKIKKLDAEAQATAKGMDDQITRLESSLQLARGNRDKFADLQEQYETAKLRKTMFEKRTAGELDRQHGTLIKAVFTGMRQNLAVYCKEKGIMLVLLAPGEDAPSGAAWLTDTQGLAASRCDARPGTVYLIRPDQHVAARWRRFDAVAVRAALARASQQPPP